MPFQNCDGTGMRKRKKKKKKMPSQTRHQCLRSPFMPIIRPYQPTAGYIPEIPERISIPSRTAAQLSNSVGYCKWPSTDHQMALRSALVNDH